MAHIARRIRRKLPRYAHQLAITYARSSRQTTEAIASVTAGHFPSGLLLGVDHRISPAFTDVIAADAQLSALRMDNAKERKFCTFKGSA